MVKDAARWQELHAACPPDIQFTRFEAVDGHQFAGDATALIQDVGKLTLPELGCMLSHVGVWKMMLEQDIPMAVVMEDDVMFGEGFNTGLHSFLQQLPEEFDIAYLGFNTNMHVQFGIPGAGKVSAIVEDYQYGLNSLHTACYRLYRAWGTCSYLISRRGASRLIDLVTNTTYPDHFHFNYATGLGRLVEYAFPTSPIDMRIMSVLEQLQAYVAFPPLCQPRPHVDTTIAQRAWDI